MSTNYTMSILKSTLLGLWLFGYGTMAYLQFAAFRHMRPNSAASLSLTTAYTTQNPMWWIGLAVSLALGYAIVRSWSPPLILWTLVLVTGLVPAGFFAFSLTVVTISKHLRQGHL